MKSVNVSEFPIDSSFPIDVHVIRPRNIISFIALINRTRKPFCHCHCHTVLQSQCVFRDLAMLIKTWIYCCYSQSRNSLKRKMISTVSIYYLFLLLPFLENSYCSLVFFILSLRFCF